MHNHPSRIEGDGMLDFKIGSYVVLISGRRDVYSVIGFLHDTDEVKLIRHVDSEPRWMAVKCWEIRLANSCEIHTGMREK